MIIPHHGLWADPGHLLAVGEDPSSLLDEYVNRVSLGEGALDRVAWKQPQDGQVAKALEQVCWAFRTLAHARLSVCTCARVRARAIV